MLNQLQHSLVIDVHCGIRCHSALEIVVVFNAPAPGVVENHLAVALECKIAAVYFLDGYALRASGASPNLLHIDHVVN